MAGYRTQPSGKVVLRRSINKSQKIERISIAQRIRIITILYSSSSDPVVLRQRLAEEFGANNYPSDNTIRV